MVAINLHDWDSIKIDIINLLKTGAPARWGAIAKSLKLDQGTLRSAALREWGVENLRELLDAALLTDPPIKLGLEVNETENTLEVGYVSKSICTLEEALQASKTDLSVWQVRDHVINFWPVAMKIKDDDGNESPLVVQLCQVKIWFIRKVLITIQPMIQPIEIKPPPPRPVAKRAAHKVQRALIIADPQVGFRRRLHSSELTPFHDRRVLDIALQISESERFDELILVGDMLDLSEWSTKFNPEPEFYWTTQPALVEWAWWLAQFAPIRRKRYLEGNHEKRMRDLIGIYAKGAYGLHAVDELELPPALSVERLLAFHTLGIEYIKGYPDNKFWLNKNVLIRHGDVVRAGPGDTAKAVVNKTTYTTIFGHIHRRELVSRRIETRAGFAIQTAFCPGCACHVDGRVPGSKSDDQWQQGIAVIEYTDDFERIIPIPIEEGRAIYNGQLITARPRDKELETMLRKALP
ncbi:MAG: hypothetical protein HY867_06165 [Chloroflexi bacterium]|nr:hypothetical protein [Chloroflexota bacterium]